MIIHKAVYHGFIFVALILLCCCGHKNKKKDGFDVADTLLSKTISFPDRLSLLENRRFYSLDSVSTVLRGKKKIISIVDGNCMSCIIHQLNAMDSTFHRILSGHDCALIFILNVNKADSAYFMLNLQPAIKTTGMVLWDDNYAFETQNKLLTENVNLRTFLTNRENRIIQYGNPLMNPGLISRYQENLKK